MLQIAKQGGKNNDDSCGVCAPNVCTTMLQKNLNVMFNVMRYLHDVQSKTPYCVMLCEKKDIQIFSSLLIPSYCSESPFQPNAKSVYISLNLITI